MSSLWKNLSQEFGEAPIHALGTGCRIIYAREYDSTKQDVGSAKSLISNFKKEIALKEEDSRQWYYRQNAVRQFGDELLSVLSGPTHLMAVPGSKPWEHPENNQRFQDLFKYLQSKNNSLIFHWPIDARAAVPSASKDNAARDPDAIKANYVWKGFTPKGPDKLIVVDDVLTTGAHFRATVEFLRENGFTGIIVGAFWAKTVR